MNTLVAKEIRLIRPAFVAALALAVLPVWLLPYNSGGFRDEAATYLFWLGFMMLTLSSFGREFGLKTLPFLLAQPLERGRIWWTKIAVLALFLGVTFGAWCLSVGLLSTLTPTLAALREALAFHGLMLPVFAAGGLWMTLLLRQMNAAFWLALLLPISVVVAIGSLGGAGWMVDVALGIYAVAAFLLAWRRFLNLQDTAWTGGVIALGGRRTNAAQTAGRERRPWAALFWKELQLQQVTLMGMGCLLVLHLGTVGLRKAAANRFGTTTLMALEAFGGLWFLVPLLAGSQSVADERKFGTMQAHLCLPISRRAQWFVKLIMALVIGGLLSWALYWAVRNVDGISHEHWDYILTLLIFLLLALAGFYGSTLTAGVVQALPAAVLTFVFLWACTVLPMMDPGLQGMAGYLPLFIGGPMLVATVLWLSYSNFGHASESGRLWRNNALTLAGMAALSFALTGAIYHRAWEKLLPLEPPHGPARLSLAKPPAFDNYADSLAVLLPNGTLWADRVRLVSRWKIVEFPLLDKWISLGGNEFARGSNWLAAAAISPGTAAIRSDGTLWFAETPWKLKDANVAPSRKPLPGLVQIGHETNWISIAHRTDRSSLLLKRDGTLWEWGTNSFNPKQKEPRLLDTQPHRLGDDSDWLRLLSSKGMPEVFAWKTNGSAWAFLDPKLDFNTTEPGAMRVVGGILDLDLSIILRELEPGLDAWHLADLDNNRWRSLITPGNAAFAGVRGDGTLWYWNYSHQRDRRPAQLGTQSDWAEIASSSDRLVARKTDGSLWSWDSTEWGWSSFDRLGHSPARLGTHNDWIALDNTGRNVLSLSADGNLWSWPDLEPTALLAPSRRPTLIENIFRAGE